MNLFENQKKLNVEKIKINRKIQPEIKDAVNFDLRLKELEKYALDNGVPVYCVEAGSVDVIQLELVFYAGNSYEEKAMVASATNALMKNGTSLKTAFEINEYIDFYGAYLNMHCYNETAVITLHCLTKHLHSLLPLVREVITDSQFPGTELETYARNMMQRLEVNLKKCDVVADRLIDEYLYGKDHPYGRNSSVEAYSALDRESLLAFYQQYYVNGRCLIFSAGKLPENLASLLNTSFGDLPFRKDIPAEIITPRAPSPEKKIRLINDAGGVQGAIRIARPFPNRKHPEFQKVQILNTLYGGFFGSRLMSNIREDKGYTYGIYSFIQNHIHDTALVISTEAGRDVCEAAITEVYSEMKNLREGEIPEEELHLVKNYLMGTLLGDLDGPFQIIGRWKNIILNGLDEKFFYRFLETVREITPEELKALAQKYFREEEFYEMVVI